MPASLIGRHGRIQRENRQASFQAVIARTTALIKPSSANVFHPVKPGCAIAPRLAIAPFSQD
jgi:hypothetical protein